MLCYVKVKSFERERGMEVLSVVSISQSAAKQRAGRAGRTAPGEVWQSRAEQRQSRGRAEQSRGRAEHSTRQVREQHTRERDTRHPAGSAWVQVWRLYSEEQLGKMAAEQLPEIHRTNLANVVGRRESNQNRLTTAHCSGSGG